MKHTKESFSKYLNLIYNSTYMPMHFICGQNIEAVYPSWALSLDSLLSYKDSMTSLGENFHYFITDDYLYIGIVRNPSTDACVILGPVTLAPMSNENKNSIILKYSNDKFSHSYISEYFERTPVFALHRFLNIMAMINVELNNEIIDVWDKYHDTNKDLASQINRTHSADLIERKENENYHSTYYFEQEYYSYVEKGDIEGLKEFIKILPDFTQGQVASSQIRQSKNIFIASISIATRRAIAGGLDIETAYQLSDNYIQEMEKLDNDSAITLLNSNAIFDFTKRVAEAKIPQGMSPDIFHCIQYISNHVNQPLAVEEIAKVLNLERSTLSKKFKRELGFNISTFIMRRKLEEAKSLLTYSDKTISEISEYLCFSSQAYFQNVFKKKYGITPLEYRQNYG